MSTYISSAVKSEVQATISNFNKVVLDLFTLRKTKRVDEISGTKLLGPRLLARVDVDGDDSAGAYHGGGRDDAETNSTDAKDGNCGTLCSTRRRQLRTEGNQDSELTNSRLLGDSTPCSCDATTKEADLV